MRRYLINIYRHYEGFNTIKVFRVGKNFSRPYNLLMENSICYYFVYSNKSKEEIEDSYLGQEIGGFSKICLKNDEIYSDGFLYLLGDLVNIDGVRYCFNGFLLVPLDSITGFSTIVIAPAQ